MSSQARAPRTSRPRGTYHEPAIGESEEDIQAVSVRMSTYYRADRLHYEVSVMPREGPTPRHEPGWQIVARMKSGTDAVIYAKIIAKRTGARFRNYT